MPEFPSDVPDRCRYICTQCRGKSVRDFDIVTYRNIVWLLAPNHDYCERCVSVATGWAPERDTDVPPQVSGTVIREEEEDTDMLSAMRNFIKDDRVRDAFDLLLTVENFTLVPHWAAWEGTGTGSKKGYYIHGIIYIT